MLKKWIYNLALWLTSLPAIALALSALAPQISPKTFWPFAFLGLTYSVLLFINLVIFVYWLMFRKWLFLLPLTAFVLSFGLFSKTFAFNIYSKSGAGKQLSIMSYNVKNFDLYNWSENEESRDVIMGHIKNRNPDIIAFQEFYTEDENFHNIKKLINEFEFIDYHFEKTTSIQGDKFWGMAIFSKYPIVNKQRIDFEQSKNNLITYSDIQLDDNSRFRLFNVHLQSIRLGRDDLSYFQNLKKEATDMTKPTSMFHKLKEAFVKRSVQVDRLSDAVAKSPYPAIVCGDFNDTPGSYAYQQLGRHLKDSFVEAGRGWGSTYAGPLPGLRIDYIFCDPSFEVTDYSRDLFNISDHYPITAGIAY